MSLPRNNANAAQAKLIKALNNIAYAHVNRYAKAIGIQANAQKAAAAAAAAAAANPNAPNVNRLRRANAVVQTEAKNVREIGTQTKNALAAINTASPAAVNESGSPGAAAPANNSEAKIIALIARINKGNFSNSTGKFNNTKMNNNNRAFASNSRVKNAIAAKYTSTNGQGNV